MFTHVQVANLCTFKTTKKVIQKTVASGFPKEENWPWPDCAAAQPFPSPKNLAFSNRLEFSSAYCFWRVVRFSRISFQVLFLVSSDLQCRQKLLAQAILTLQQRPICTLQGVWKLGGPKKTKEPWFFFAGFPQCCHRLVANSPVMDNPNGPTEAGHPKMVTDLKSSFERRDDPDVLKICLI